MRDRIDKRFWAKVRKTKICWVWTGAAIRKGYGVFWKNGRNIPAHRFSFESAFGKIPVGLFCCHKCDNPPCVRPDHLFIGSPLDNARDRVSKSRQARGASIWTAKLSGDDVLDIRVRYSNGNGAKLAIEYGIGQATVSKIILRKSWRHI